MVYEIYDASGEEYDDMGHVRRRCPRQRLSKNYCLITASPGTKISDAKGGRTMHREVYKHESVQN